MTLKLSRDGHLVQVRVAISYDKWSEESTLCQRSINRFEIGCYGL